MRTPAHGLPSPYALPPATKRCAAMRGHRQWRDGWRNTGDDTRGAKGASMKHSEKSQTSPEEIIAKNVKRLRREQRIGKERFCLMVNIGRPTLNKVEKGAPNTRLSTIRKVAEGLGVEVIDLLR
ncbi:XRE family transcriptional regulator [Rubneribacter badeniensis]|uniref:XRE family transcriptional regulator n=2 Tax=Rubneribacter badeniensis TaxID=2070688 RepID=A0A2K2U5I8_9ACTN|nr:hypothetical protein B5F41_10850 [Gordonibacter sp. An232A]PNV65478.1 XRE family transcriptional regulator [Rubneribacter badeniensis]